MGVYRRRLLGFLLVVLSFATTASAQDSLRDRSRELQSKATIVANLERAQLHYQAFYLFSTLDIGDVALDENLLGTSSEKHDFAIGITAPQRVYLVPTKKMIFSLDFDPTYYAFIRDSSQNEFGYLYRGHVHFLLNHLYLDLNAGAAHQSTVDRLELQHLAKQRLSFYGMVGELRLSSRTDINFEGDENRIRYTGNILPLEGDLSQLNRHQETLMARVTHHTFPRTSLTFSAEDDEYHFDDKFRDSRRTGAYIGAHRHGAGTSVFDLLVGVAKLDFKDPAQKGYQGVLVAATWSAQIRHRYGTSLNLQRDLEFSTFENNSYYVTTQAGGTLGVPLGRRLTIDFFAKGGTDQYQVESEELDGVLDKRLDRVALIGAGFLYNITDRLGAGLALGYFIRRSNFPQFDDSGIQLLLRLSIHP